MLIFRQHPPYLSFKARSHWARNCKGWG